MSREEIPTFAEVTEEKLIREKGGGFLPDYKVS